jgi:hypothetical protein
VGELKKNSINSIKNKKQKKQKSGANSPLVRGSTQFSNE